MKLSKCYLTFYRMSFDNCIVQKKRSEIAGKTQGKRTQIHGQ